MLTGRCMTYLCTAHSNRLVNRKVSGTVSHSSQRHVVDVLDVDVEGRRAHRVDDDDVEIAVVPADDARAVFLAEIDLPLT